MEFRTYNGYILSRLDLAVLLLAAGKDGICSLRLPRADEVDDMKMLTSAFHLTREGLLDVPVDERALDEGYHADENSGNAVPSASAMEFIAPLTQAQRVIQLVPYDKELPQKYLYITPTRVAIVEADEKGDDSIRVSSFGREELDHFLQVSYGLEDNLPVSQDAAEDSLTKADPEGIERDNLLAMRLPDVSDMETWMNDAAGSTGLTPVFALLFLRGSDAAVTAHGMVLRGRMCNWRIGCASGDIVSDSGRIEVWPAYEGMWADL